MYQRYIKQAENSAPGPDGIKYSDLGVLDQDDLEALSLRCSTTALPATASQKTG